MKALQGLIGHELRSFLLRPWAHAWVTLWVISCAVTTLLHAKLLNGQQAQLTPLFAYLPWLGALFLPLLGINLWSRESRLGTFVWLLSLPHSTLRCLLVKYGSAWILMTVGLLLTWPLTATVLYLGNPDLGIIASSYIGCLGFLSVQLGLCLLASCMTSRPMSTYALGFAFCLLYNLPACDLLSENLSHAFSSGIFTDISRWSGSYHLLSFLRGVIDSRDFFYWILSLAVLLSASYGLLIHRRSISSSNWRHPEARTIYGLLAATTLSALLLFLSFSFHKRWDLTADELYSLSEGSLAIVTKLPEPVHVRFFISRSHPSLEPALRTYGQRIEELLRELTAVPSKTFSYSIVDPLTRPEREMEARTHGLTAVGSSVGDPVFFGAVFSMGAQTLGISYFDPQREDQLEYELIEALVKISQKNKPILGIMSSLPMMREQGVRDWAVVSALRNLYQVISVPSNSDQIAANIHTLLVIHPKNISEKTEYALDQFVVSGGNLMLALDPLCRSELVYNNPLASAQTSQLQLASQMPRLLKAWGLDFNSQRMVGDASRLTPMQSAYQTVDYPYYITLQSQDLNATHLISNRIRQLIFAESGWFGGYRNNGLHWSILAQTSTESGTIPTSLASYMQAAALSAQLKPDEQQRVLAGVLFGRFFSAFSNAPAGSPIMEHKRDAEKDNAVVLFADVDFIADHHTVDKIQSRNQMILKPKNDNLSFFLRSVEFAGGNKDLIAVRNSRRLPRPFVRFQKLQQEGQSQWQDQAEKVSLQLQEIETQIQGSQNPEEDEALSTIAIEQEQKLKSLRQEEARLRAEQRHIRLSMQESTEDLKQRLIWGNVLLTPILALMGWSIRVPAQRLARKLRRRRRSVKV